MALFERLRRGSRRTREDAATEPRLRIEDLADQLPAIREAAAAPEDALEPALQAVVEASGACAGAICLYDVRQCILRLTSEVGLSDEGCQQLRTVRRADPACWDIPLHGLLNRRAYLIESANRNRYVPRLVESRSPVTTVICIPMFAGMTPLGSLVLVSAAPRTFTQRDIETLWGPLRGLAAIIEEIRRRVTVSAPSGDLPVIDRAHIERSALAAERDHLLSELAARRAEGETLATALEEQIATVATLRTELDATRAECQRLEREATSRVELPVDDEAVRRHVAALEQERDELREALASAEATRALLERREGELESARAAAESAAAEARAESRRASESVDRHGRESDQVRHELEAEIARLTERVQGLETELAAAVGGGGETATLAARIEELEGRLETTGRDAAAARSELEGREADLARHEAEATRLREQHAEATARVTSLDEELALIRGERDQAREVEHARATEITELQATIADLTAERDAAQARAAGVDELTTTAERHEARVTELERLLAEEREAKVAATSEAAELRARVEASAAAEETRAAGTAEMQEEVTRLRETCERLQRERSDLAEAHEAALQRLSSGAPSSGAITMGVTSMFGSDLEGDIDDAVTVISVPPEPLTPIIESGSTPLLVVIDSSEAWKDLEIDGYEIYVAPPDTDAAAAVASLDPARIVANLASGVMNTLGALRKAGSTVRFWGCIADPTGGRAVPLGMIEPVIPPIDPDAIIAKLGPYASRGSRLVTIGTDVDALMSLRQALARRSVSVSMAWDAKQGMDLIHQTRPDAMVVDLDLPKKDGYALVARGVAQLDPPPYTLLVGGRSGSGKAFAEALQALEDTQHVAGLKDMLTAVCARDDGGPSAKEGRRQRRLPYGARGRTKS